MARTFTSTSKQRTDTNAKVEEFTRETFLRDLKKAARRTEEKGPSRSDRGKR